MKKRSDVKTIRMKPSLQEALEKASDETGIPISRIVEQALEVHLQQEKAVPTKAALKRKDLEYIANVERLFSEGLAEVAADLRMYIDRCMELDGLRKAQRNP